jgi:phage tail sheath protein FI
VNLAGLLDVEVKPTETELDTLNVASPPVNVIRNVSGYGIRVMGGRTLKPGQADKYISARRSLIYIKTGLKNLTQFAVFEPNDQTLWASLQHTCEAFLREFHALGGLKGDTAASSFYVKCDGVLNPPAVVANGEVRVEAGVALQFPAEFVVIRVGQFEGGSSVVES